MEATKLQVETKEMADIARGPERPQDRRLDGAPGDDPEAHDHVADLTPGGDNQDLTREKEIGAGDRAPGHRNDMNTMIIMMTKRNIMTTGAVLDLTRPTVPSQDSLTIW